MPTVGHIMEPGLGFYIATVVPILTFKLGVLLVGYLIARLGYNLLLKGVTGQFKFRGEFRGFKGDLVSASPGLFFMLMATALLAVGVLEDKPFGTTRAPSSVEESTETEDDPVLRPTEPEG